MVICQLAPFFPPFQSLYPGLSRCIFPRCMTSCQYDASMREFTHPELRDCCASPAQSQLIGDGCSLVLVVCVLMAFPVGTVYNIHGRESLG